MGKGILNGVIPAPGAALPATVSQSEAEAGTAITDRIWTAERVKQAIAALESGGAAFRGALVYPTSSQTILDAVPLSMVFQVAKYDTDNIWEGVTNPDRLTVPTGVTKIKLLGSARITGMASGVHVALNINWFNSADVLQEFVGLPRLSIDPVGSFSNNITVTSAVINVAAGDYFNLRVFQDSGGNATSAPGPDEAVWFAMEIIE